MVGVNRLGRTRQRVRLRPLADELFQTFEPEPARSLGR